MLNTTREKIKTLTELQNILVTLKGQGKKIVFTNGCFDLLHFGHIYLLAQAKSLGDVLIVGLNSDKSVRALKGNERPIIPQDDRAMLLASLMSVDFVVIFDELTPNRLIESLKPEIHVKGGDYKQDDLPEAHLVHSYGGKVVIIPKVDGRSTTELVSFIKTKVESAPIKNILGVIPARYKSVRFEGKVLAKLHGKPIVQHVYERAKQAKTLSDVIVATDDEKVMTTVKAFGGKAIMTSPEHSSGTDRAAEIATKVECDIIVNIQGDEPLIAPEAIDSAVQPFFLDPTLKMTTLATQIDDENDYLNPNVVKVVIDRDYFAIYFSRSPLPFFRPKGKIGKISQFNIPKDTSLRPLRHIGLYAYRKSFLEQFSRWAPTPLEKTEGLEQLRVLEHGFRIKVVITDYKSFSVDTLEDLERLEKM